MTIDEAISHAREVAECQKMSARLIEDNAYIPESVDKEAITYGNTICANERKQLQIGTGGRTMGRLIDAETLKQELYQQWFMDILLTQTSSEDMFYALAQKIDQQPTAYDTDKVVEQLEEVEKIMTSPVNIDCFGEECKASDCMVCLISKAIEIVKGGVVDG